MKHNERNLKLARNEVKEFALGVDVSMTEC